MPPKRNPLNLNPLQLKTLTLLQALARLPGHARPPGEDGAILVVGPAAAAWRPFPSRRRGGACRATRPGSPTAAAWVALERKGLIKSQFPVGGAADAGRPRLRHRPRRRDPPPRRSRRALSYQRKPVATASGASPLAASASATRARSGSSPGCRPSSSAWMPPTIHTLSMTGAARAGDVGAQAVADREDALAVGDAEQREARLVDRRIRLAVPAHARRPAPRSAAPARRRR